MDTSVHFHSDDLQKAIAETAPVLENLEGIRNKVSQDIKNLEDYLQKIGVNTPFRLFFGKCFVPPEDQSDCDTRFMLEESGSGSGEIHEECLAWDQDKTGKFRLLHELNRWEGGVEVDAPGGPFFWNNDTHSCQSRPLIETKFEVRKRFSKELPRFVRALSKHLVGEPFVEPPLASDEIPF